MWKLAVVEGAGAWGRTSARLYIYDSNGVQHRDHKSYDQAISELLREGWEPFSGTSESHRIFFRMKVS
jgi:hypothetical protein